MRGYVLATLAGVWLADGIALLLVPRWTIERVRAVIEQSPLVFRWEGLSIVAGFILAVFSLGLPYQPLWAVTGLAMILKGLFLWRGPSELRKKAVDWCLGREEIDYRFWGLALSALAVLLLHALGWIGLI